MKHIVVPLVALLFAGCAQKGTGDDSSLSSVTNKGNSLRSSTNFQGSPLELFRNIYESKHQQFKSALKFETGVCPPARFTVNGKKFTLERDPFAIGSDTVLYQSTDRSLVVKVHELPMAEAMESLWREEAAAAALDPLIVSGQLTAPRFYQPKFESRVSELCQLRMVTMDLAGRIDLQELVITYGFQSAEVVRQIAVGGLHALEQVHSVGLLHGDIYSGNFLLDEQSDEIQNLRLIDFGRAREFRDPKTGAHIEDGPAERGYYSEIASYNSVLLSVNELQGQRLSRRDDLFRFAELLLFLLDGDDALYTFKYRTNAEGESELVRLTPPRREMVKRKRFRKFSENIPSEFVDFYAATMRLEFAEDPDYAGLRALFQDS